VRKIIKGARDKFIRDTLSLNQSNYSVVYYVLMEPLSAHENVLRSQKVTVAPCAAAAKAKHNNETYLCL